MVNAVGEESGTVVETLSFSVEGSFITNLAREKFWYMKEPIEKLEEFLFLCMQEAEGTRKVTVEEKKEMVKKILNGQARLDGNTRDGSYGYTEDFFDKRLTIWGKPASMTCVNELQKDIEEDKWEDLDIEGVDGPKFFKKRDVSDDRDIVGDFLSTLKYKDNYGWLSPDGEFFPSEFGTHEDRADVIIEQHEFWRDEYLRRSEKEVIGGSGNFLVNYKGWILLHNPRMGTAEPLIGDILRTTRYQREFLYDYYLERGYEEKACYYLTLGD